MTNIIGLDVSFYEDDPETQRHIDYTQAKKSQVEFVIVRVGQNVWVDSSFAQSWKDAKTAGLPRGSYFFWDSRVTPQAQAKLWFDTMKGDFGELPLFADFEEAYDGAYGGWKNFKIFLDELHRLMPAKEIFIYTAYYYWLDHMPATEREYFHQYGLWIANYNAGKPAVPAPWGEDEWMFWQWSESGNGELYGTEGEVDMNFFNGDLAKFRARFPFTPPVVIPPPAEAWVNTHTGVKVKIVERFGCKCVITIMDPVLARVWVTPGGYTSVGEAVRKHGAQVGFNGGGWPNVNTPGQVTNEKWISDGVVLQNTAVNNRGFISISKTGAVAVHEHNDSVNDPWQAWGQDRKLNAGTEFNSLITDTWTKDARTGAGVTGEGTLIVLSVQGNDIGNTGFTFPQMWDVMREFGALDAGNNDGGSSSAVVNLALSPDSLILPSDKGGVQAKVINQVLIFAVPLGDPYVPPIEGVNMRYSMKTINATNIRSGHNTNDPNVAGFPANGLPANTIVEGDELFTATVELKKSGSVYQMKGDEWVKITYGKFVGWVALTHMGKPVCNSFIDNGVVVEPPVVDPDDDIDVSVNRTAGVTTVHVDGEEWKKA